MATKKAAPKKAAPKKKAAKKNPQPQSITKTIMIDKTDDGDGYHLGVMAIGWNRGDLIGAIAQALVQTCISGAEKH